MRTLVALLMVALLAPACGKSSKKEKDRPADPPAQTSQPAAATEPAAAPEAVKPVDRNDPALHGATRKIGGSTSPAVNP